jgi:hypothetical protein
MPIPILISTTTRDSLSPLGPPLKLDMSDVDTGIDNVNINLLILLQRMGGIIISLQSP